MSGVNGPIDIHPGQHSTICFHGRGSGVATDGVTGHPYPPAIDDAGERPRRMPVGQLVDHEGRISRSALRDGLSARHSCG